MELDGIPPVGSTETSPGINQRSQSGKRGASDSARGSNSEPSPERENADEAAAEFTALDPVVGVVLAQVSPAATEKVAQKVKEILPD